MFSMIIKTGGHPTKHISNLKPLTPPRTP